jgi:hypothetical protein
VKKNRRAATMLFMVGAGMPASRCSIWNRRTSPPGETGYEE